MSPPPSFSEQETPLIAAVSSDHSSARRCAGPAVGLAVSLAGRCGPHTEARRMSGPGYWCSCSSLCSGARPK